VARKPRVTRNASTIFPNIFDDDSSDYYSEQSQDVEKKWMTTEMIGYIDKLGIFRCDIDPDHDNGYLEEKIEVNENIFQNLISIDEVKHWQNNLFYAFQMISKIYKRLIHKKVTSMSSFTLNHMKSNSNLKVNTFKVLIQIYIAKRDSQNYQIESSKTNYSVG
jgi:hypothetical protein